MVISNYNNETVRIQSEYMERFLQSVSPSTNICVTGKINCCGSAYNECIEISDFWSIDLSTEVLVKASIQSIIFRNTETDKFFTVNLSVSLAEITSDLGNDFIAVSSIQNKIDTTFNNRGVYCSTIVTAIGNILKISRVPEGFLPSHLFFENLGYNKDFVYGLGSSIYFLDNVLCITPAFFGVTELINGVYSFELTGYDGLTAFRESNAAFIDVNMSCTIAKTLKALIDESNDTIICDKENTVTYIHLLHYALTIGSNCGCNTENLCKAYTELVSLIASSGTSINTSQNGCGC